VCSAFPSAHSTVLVSEQGDVRHTVSVVLFVLPLKNCWPSGCLQGKWRQFVLSSFLQLSFCAFPRFFFLAPSLAGSIFTAIYIYMCVCVCVELSFFSIIVSLTSVPDVLCISCNTPLLLCISQMCDSWKMAKPEAFEAEKGTQRARIFI